MLSHFYRGLPMGPAGVAAKNALNCLGVVTKPLAAVMKIKLLTFLIIALGLGQIAVLAAEGTEPPVPVRTVPPVFPEEMRRDGISGVVTVSILIDEKGNVQEPKVVKTTHEAFSQPAIDALSRWKFKPARQGGEAVAMRVNIPIQFTNKG
jgi:periplasmic protein TonB